MKIWKAGALIAGWVVIAGNVCAQEDMRRFKLTPFSEMTPEQRVYADATISGPVAATGGAAVVPGAAFLGSPFNVYLRSPVLAEHLRKVFEHIRFKSSLPPRLNELAILVTARQWTA
jgi:4-carboxymuconolactone decarboxylase